MSQLQYLSFHNTPYHVSNSTSVLIPQFPPPSRYQRYLPKPQDTDHVVRHLGLAMIEEGMERRLQC